MRRWVFCQCLDPSTNKWDQHLSLQYCYILDGSQVICLLFYRQLLLGSKQPFIRNTSTLLSPCRSVSFPPALSLFSHLMDYFLSSVCCPHFFLTSLPIWCRRGFACFVCLLLSSTAMCFITYHCTVLSPRRCVKAWRITLIILSGGARSGPAGHRALG